MGIYPFEFAVGTISDIPALVQICKGWVRTNAPNRLDTASRVVSVVRRHPIPSREHGINGHHTIGVDGHPSNVRPRLLGIVGVSKSFDSIPYMAIVCFVLEMAKPRALLFYNNAILIIEPISDHA